MDLENRIRLTWDPETDVAYLYLAETGPAEILGPTLLLERDDDFHGIVALDFTVADGRAVGLEFLEASRCLPAALLATAARETGHARKRLEERVLRQRFVAPAADERVH